MNENAGIAMAAPAEAYRDRRRRLGGGIDRPMVIFAGRARPRNYVGNDYPFRAASTFLYFGGPPLEGAAWVLEPGNDGDRGCNLVRPEAGFDEIVWVGNVLSDEKLAHACGVGVEQLVGPDGLDGLIGGRDACAVCPPCGATREWMGRLGLKEASGAELLAIIDMRLAKDGHELAAMRRAADITMAAHRAVMRATAVGKTEAELAAEFCRVLVAHRAEPSFSPMVNVHGEVLHPGGYVHTLADGDLLLVDAGAEEPGGYACDVTRTYPVNGVFTGAQRQIYDTVLRAQRAAVEACRVGARFREVHDAAAALLCAGLVEVGLLRGKPSELVGRGAHALFFTHGLGHLIGLDVHDMEDFGDLAGYAAGRTRRTRFGDKFLRLDRDLAPGVTLTIEPGLYLVPAVWANDELVGPFADCVDRAAVDELLAAEFGGIRIEDTVCVTDGAPEVLTADLTKDADAVTRIVTGG